MNPGYERFLAKRRKPLEPTRSPVAQDRDRIVHSSALRRLQGKTQIVGVQAGDFFRTRLTHTLECAQIGRSIARRCGKGGWQEVSKTFQDFEDLVEAACLGHDLGHPPFGHNGEEALGAQMACFNGSLFEGNAQSFRVVTFTESKDAGLSASDSDRWVGLNLTRTTLRALCKYPWSETEHAKHGPHGKFNVYDDPVDGEYFSWVWEGDTPQRTLAAHIMDASDDIAYAAHDFEDGVWAGMIPLYDLLEGAPDAVRRLGDKVLKRDKERETRAFPDGKIEASLEGLLSEVKDAYWARRPFDRSRRSRKDLKKFTADLIHYFIENVTAGEQFNKPTDEVLRRLDLLTGMAWVWMIERSDLATWKYGQEKLIAELFEGYWTKPEMLPQRDEWRMVQETSAEKRGKWPEKARFIRDHIAGMTDAYAKEVHREMHGAVQTIDLALTY